MGMCMSIRAYLFIGTSKAILSFIEVYLHPIRAISIHLQEIIE